MGGRRGDLILPSSQRDRCAAEFGFKVKQETSAAQTHYLHDKGKKQYLFGNMKCEGFMLKLKKKHFIYS